MGELRLSIGSDYQDASYTTVLAESERTASSAPSSPAAASR